MQNEFYGESARAVGVLQGAMVELALERAIKSTLRRDLTSGIEKSIFGFDGVFGTFSAKIKFGYAVPLFGSITKHDLDIIRLMRNEFAHCRKPISFDLPVVRDICINLQIPETDIKRTPYGYWNATPHDDLALAVAGDSAKMKFVTSCHTIATYLLDFSERGQNVVVHETGLP